MARRADGVGQVVKGVGARVTDGSRIRTSETVGIEAVGYGMFEITFGAKGNAKSLEQIHWGAAGGAHRGIVCDEEATAGTADSMGYVIWGVKGDEDGGGFKAD